MPKPKKKPKFVMKEEELVIKKLLDQGKLIVNTKKQWHKRLRQAQYDQLLFLTFRYWSAKMVELLFESTRDF